MIIITIGARSARIARAMMYVLCAALAHIIVFCAKNVLLSASYVALSAKINGKIRKKHIISEIKVYIYWNMLYISYR